MHSRQMCDCWRPQACKQALGAGGGVFGGMRAGILWGTGFRVGSELGCCTWWEKPVPETKDKTRVSPARLWSCTCGWQ